MLPFVQSAEEMPPWPPTGHIPDPVCRACGWERTSTDEPDGCLGWLPETVNACCGHGRLYLKDGEITESTELCLDWRLLDGEGMGFWLMIGPGKTLHEAFDAWRAGDVGLFSRIVSFLVSDHIRLELGSRLERAVCHA